MRFQNLQGLARKGTVVWLALGALLLATRGVPVWWRAVETSRDDAHAAVRLMNDANAIIEAAPSMRDSLRTRRAVYTNSSSTIITAVSAAEAASHLSGVVSLIASNAGVALRSLTLVPDSAAYSGFGRPRVRADARGDISGLTQMLLLLEGGSTQLRVAELVVNQSDPLGGERPEELTFSITIEGLAKMQKVEPKGGAE